MTDKPKRPEPPKEAWLHIFLGGFEFGAQLTDGSGCNWTPHSKKRSRPMASKALLCLRCGHIRRHCECKRGFISEADVRDPHEVSRLQAQVAELEAALLKILRFDMKAHHPRLGAYEALEMLTIAKAALNSSKPK